jgi:hypothetical protein
MVKITKEDSDRIVEEFLISGAKIDNSKEFAIESMSILNDDLFKQLLYGSLFIKIVDSLNNEQSNDYKNMRLFINNITNAMITGATEEQLKVCSPNHVIPFNLTNSFSEKVTDDWKNPKLKFAFDQFVQSFVAFEVFEKKYPKIAKII